MSHLRKVKQALLGKDRELARRRGFGKYRDRLADYKITTVVRRKKK